MTTVKLGRYVATDPNWCPIIVTDNGQRDGYRTPWVKYRFEWEDPDEGTAVTLDVFKALLDAGYVHDSSDSSKGT